MAKELTIGIVACEESGDYLGSKLMAELARRIPQAKFIGVGGRLMQQQGLQSLYQLHELTALGLLNILSQLPKFWRIRRNLIRQLRQQHINLFIGIDAPEFNLGLEKKLRCQQIKTVHYISPSIWAWRPKRIRTLAKATDLVLCIYPFEPEVFATLGTRYQATVNNVYIGHSLADALPLSSDQAAARAALKLANPTKAKLIAILPGSRTTELKRHTALFTQAALKCLAQNPNLVFLYAAVDESARIHIQQVLKTYEFPAAKVKVFSMKSHSLITAADAVLLASGTASLEAMLIKRPMVVAYKIDYLSYRILKSLATTKFVALPNILCGAPVVPELLMHEATATKLAAALLTELNKSFVELQEKYTMMHHKLSKNSSQQAASAILGLLS